MRKARVASCAGALLFSLGAGGREMFALGLELRKQGSEHSPYHPSPFSSSLSAKRPPC